MQGETGGNELIEMQVNCILVSHLHIKLIRVINHFKQPSNLRSIYNRKQLLSHLAIYDGNANCYQHHRCHRRCIARSIPLSFNLTSIVESFSQGESGFATIVRKIGHSVNQFFWNLSRNTKQNQHFHGSCTNPALRRIVSYKLYW